VLANIICRFLLVSLNMDTILGEVTIRQRRKKLEDMALGNGLSDAYTATLTRLKAQKGNKPELGLKVLMWVLNSERPLRAKELCHALGVEIGSTDLDLKNIPSLGALLSCCLGLVTVELSSSTIRLVHFTLQEHLSSDPTQIHNPHSMLAEVCLTYLNFRCIRDLPLDDLLGGSEIHALLDYASGYWGDHARRGMTENVKALALRLLARFDEHISGVILVFDSDLGRRGMFDMETGQGKFTGLHGAAFLGIVEIFAAVLELKEWSVNAGDCFGHTPLTWAAIRGHVAVVRMLLEREDVDPDQPDTNGHMTPFLWAVEEGHEGVAMALLGRGGVNPNAVSVFGYTALQSAEFGGNVGMVKILLERKEVNPNQTLADCRESIFSWAVMEGHEGIVKILLEREDLDLNSECSDSDHGPICWAVERGREWALKLLLKRQDFDTNTAMVGWGRTPLTCAAECGNEVAVKMLLEREDVIPDQADAEDGRTPLSWAAEGGNGAAVKMLLERGDVNPDQADTEYGNTALVGR